jgi:DNA-binding LytR/AlgR family response regulator
LQQNTGNNRKQHSKNNTAQGVFNCMIAENKNNQNTVLRDYINKVSKLHFTGKAESPEEIFEHTILYKVDIIFWDIHLPESNIIERLKEAGHHPLVVCIATKPDQEKQETDADIFSYLYKPFSFDCFLAVINSIKNYSNSTANLQHIKSKNFLFVKSEYKIIKVKFEDILFCEGMKDYTQIYLKGKNEPILTLNNLKLFASKLPADEFIRVHRSYIVSIMHIDSIVRNEIYIDKKIIPVGDSYKDDFYQVIEANS